MSYYGLDVMYKDIKTFKYGHLNFLKGEVTCPWEVNDVV